jgi:hypothetical protein
MNFVDTEENQVIIREVDDQDRLIEVSSNNSLTNSY